MGSAPVDVLVVGAGPAGCAAGITAARAGAQVLVLERARFPRAKICGDGLSNRAVRMADRLMQPSSGTRSLPHAEVRFGAAILPDGARLERSFEREPGLIVARTELDDQLRRSLESTGAVLRQEETVRSLLTERGRVIGVAGSDRSWLALVVIAADGASSVARAVVGRRRRRGRALGVAITGYYEDVSHDDVAFTAEHYFEHDLPYGYGWCFPPVDGRTNAGVYLRWDGYQRSRQRLPALLHRFITRHPERFAQAHPLGRSRVGALPLAFPRGSRAAPGLLCCGDAGCFVDPLSGEGIWQALHTGVLAGQHALLGLERAGVDAARVKAYERACQREVLWPSLGRFGAQEAMRLLLATGAHRNRWVRRALAWGYRGDALEMSKRTG